MQSNATESAAFREKVERLYDAWDDAMDKGDISTLVALYAADAIIESPLIYEFGASATGILHGRDAFRPFYEEVARRQSQVIRPRHHDDYVLKGQRILWEYPRLTRLGEQSEFVESWDVNGEFLIQCHRVYWGWSRIAALKGRGFTRSGEQ